MHPKQPSGEGAASQGCWEPVIELAGLDTWDPGPSLESKVGPLREGGATTALRIGCDVSATPRHTDKARGRRGGGDREPWRRQRALAEPAGLEAPPPRAGRSRCSPGPQVPRLRAGPRIPCTCSRGEAPSPGPGKQDLAHEEKARSRRRRQTQAQSPESPSADSACPTCRPGRLAARPPVRSREGARRRSGCQDVKTQLALFEVYK